MNPKKSFSLKDQLFFLKQLSYLVRGGISVEESLTIIARQYSKPWKSEIIERCRHNVHAGYSLAASLEIDTIVTTSVISLLRGSEETGTLAEGLDLAATELKKRHELRTKILGSLLYPSIIGLSTLMLTFFLIFYIFPKIRSLFTSIRAELPWTTQTIIMISDIGRHYWLPISIGLVLGVVALWYSFKYSSRFKQKQELFLLSIPLTRTLIQHYYIALITRSLGSLLKAHTPFHQSLHLTAKSISHTLYKKFCLQVSERHYRGEPLATILSDYPRYIPENARHMLDVAEQSGSLADTCLYIADMYEQEVHIKTKRMTELIEPITMLLMGSIVGFISISIIAPIYAITQQLKH